MMKLAKNMLKSMGAVIGIVLILIFIVYSWWLRPYFTRLDMGKIKFESGETLSSGFPFNTVLHIKNPRIYYEQRPFWVGEEMRLEWSLLQPTRITIHLHGQHVVSLNLHSNLKTAFHLRDTTGYVHLYSLQNMLLDIKGEDISIRLPSRPGSNKTAYSVEKIYVYYDGPTALSSDQLMGDLSVSAEELSLPAYINPPFKGPIERLDFKAVKQDNQSHTINNIVFFWDDFRAAGNGSLYHKNKQTGTEGNFLMAVQGLESLIGGMYKSGRFTPQQVRQSIRNITMLRLQQKRRKEDPIYLPVLFEDNMIKIAGIPFLALHRTEKADKELQKVISGGTYHGTKP